MFIVTALFCKVTADLIGGLYCTANPRLNFPGTLLASQPPLVQAVYVYVVFRKATCEISLDEEESNQPILIYRFRFYED